jgi:hypothetical protein
LAIQGEKIRHNAARLGRLIVTIARGHAPRFHAPRVALGVGVALEVEGEAVCFDHHANI